MFDTQLYKSSVKIYRIYICVFCHEKHLLKIEFSVLALPPLSQCVSIYAVYLWAAYVVALT